MVERLFYCRSNKNSAFVIAPVKKSGLNRYSLLFADKNDIVADLGCIESEFTVELFLLFAKLDHARRNKDFVTVKKTERFQSRFCSARIRVVSVVDDGNAVFLRQLKTVGNAGKLSDLTLEGGKRNAEPVADCDGADDVQNIVTADQSC